MNIVINTTYVRKSSIWNTLIPSKLELPHDIDDSDDNEKKKMMIYHHCQTKMRKPIIHVDFKPSNFLVQ